MSSPRETTHERTPREPMIVAAQLTKAYGNFHAIEDVTFQIEKGQTVGFLGPNGAGKTTTMRIITGFVPPTSGTATIGGYDVVENSREARKLVGYLPETVPLYTDMSVKGYLNFSGTLRGMNSKHLRNRIDDVVDVCGLNDYTIRLWGGCPRGTGNVWGLPKPSCMSHKC